MLRRANHLGLSRRIGFRARFLIGLLCRIAIFGILLGETSCRYSSPRSALQSERNYGVEVYAKLQGNQGSALSLFVTVPETSLQPRNLAACQVAASAQPQSECIPNQPATSPLKFIANRDGRAFYRLIGPVAPEHDMRLIIIDLTSREVLGQLKFRDKTSMRFPENLYQLKC